MAEPKVHTLAGGDLALWAEPGGSVMLKVLSERRDPIELGEGEVEELIEVLTALSKEF